ncbi:uncharacterized protein LOC131688230 [Topomyia yanbarensis]|uniref:uncharacterized protein LOC131688230 n=1 Tax=Topomyia yanbarensis TaxID=2498891 RepID=UPI00273A77E6|nr:uncharacterized protein LOC131688230 [Topomyia yanbarensis]
MSTSAADTTETESVHMSSHLPGIERLAGRDNWPTWKFAVQTFLELEDLWSAVKPTENANGTRQAVDVAKDRRARAKIILLLDPINYVHVKEAATARDVWLKLEDTFEDKGLTRKVGLLHKLIRADLTSCSSMDEYVNQIVSTAHQLEGIGFPISEEWIGTLLLAGLPEEYRPMIMALENSGIAITGDAIKTKLLQELKFSTQDLALAVNRKQKFRWNRQLSDSPESGGSKHKNDLPKGPKCRKCQKYGHIARDCRSFKQANLSKESLCVVLSMIPSGKETDWFIDSGASVHMTSHREFLQHVKPSSGAVVAANGGNMKGYTIIFTIAGCQVINRNGDIIATAKRENDLFKLEQRQQDTKIGLACSSAVDLEVWHQRLGHLNLNSVRKLASGMAKGVTIVGADPGDCKVCPMGKHYRQPFSKRGSRASEVLEVVHTDICGPMEVNSNSGSRFYIVFVDDRSRKMWVYFLKTKAEPEVLRVFKEFHALVERQSGRKLKVIRSDNGREYVNNGFQSYLKRHANRKRNVEINIVQLDIGEDVVPNVRGPENRIEQIDDDSNDENFFDTDCVGEIDDSVTEFRGFDDTTGAVISDSVVLPPQTSSNPPQSPVLRRSGREHRRPGKYDDFEVSYRDLPPSNLLQETFSDVPNDDESQYDLSEGPDSQGQVNHKLSCAVSTVRSLLIDGDPLSHDEALAREDSANWKKAMFDEYEALLANNTWTLTELPSGRKSIKCKWVFKTKYDANGNVDRHKARLVVKGYSQRKGVDYDETYSPVVRHSSHLFALSARYNLPMDQMDATTAFLQGELEEEIFMEQPPCFEKPNQRGMVCRLNKALYGLKQSSRVWNAKLNAALKRFGLISSKFDPCLYYRIAKGKILFIAIYVDDVFIVYNDEALMNEIKLKLSDTFRMKDLGPISSCRTPNRFELHPIQV